MFKTNRHFWMFLYFLYVFTHVNVDIYIYVHLFALCVFLYMLCSMEIAYITNCIKLVVKFIGLNECK